MCKSLVRPPGANTRAQCIRTYARIVRGPCYARGYVRNSCLPIGRRHGYVYLLHCTVAIFSSFVYRIASSCREREISIRRPCRDKMNSVPWREVNERRKKERGGGMVDVRGFAGTIGKRESEERSFALFRQISFEQRGRSYLETWKLPRSRGRVPWLLDFIVLSARRTRERTMPVGFQDGLTRRTRL